MIAALVENGASTNQAFRGSYARLPFTSAREAGVLIAAPGWLVSHCWLARAPIWGVQVCAFGEVDRLGCFNAKSS
jgi:hypothetical protein